MKFVIRLTIILLLFSFGLMAQKGHRDPFPEDRNANPDRQLVSGKPTAAQLKHEAEELSALATTVPADVEKANSGLLPKDLKENLKRIEKLSKKLRDELALN